MSEVAELAMKLRGLCDPLSERMPDYHRINLFVGYGAEAADALEALARENAELREQVAGCSANERQLEGWLEKADAQLAAMTSVVEAARVLADSDMGAQGDGADEFRRVRHGAFIVLCRALAKLEAAHADA